jgi:AraC family carnitine catabolism transcriptional activator
MEANIEEPISLPELAAYAGVSERQIERLFRDHLGCTPNAYYMEIRLNMARTRLLYSEDSIMEIAHSCGFDSCSYFSKCYRRLFAITPSCERRRTRSVGADNAGAAGRDRPARPR